jgi:hypothetical protein
MFVVLLGVFAVTLPVVADAPQGRYVMFPMDGVVGDTLTTLAWQEPLDANMYTWANAMSYCVSLSRWGGGWRLPTRAELLTLVDPTKRSPAIDTNAFFASTAVNDFWSASPYVAESDTAWVISFSGGATYGDGVTHMHSVRCVQ